MKLVKKLLRVFPFIIFLGFFVYAIMAQNSTIESPLLSVQTFISQCDVVLKDSLKNMIDFLCFGSSEINLFFDDILCYIYNVEDVVDVWADINGLSIFPIFLLWYELLLSFLFLLFDVFNWFLSLGRNLLKKGGKYDD